MRVDMTLFFLLTTSRNGSFELRRLGKTFGCHVSRIKGLRNDEGSVGQVQVKFRVGSGGIVNNASVIQNTTGSTTLSTCITSRIKRIKFPVEAEGADVTWPLNLFPS